MGFSGELFSGYSAHSSGSLPLEVSIDLCRDLKINSDGAWTSIHSSALQTSLKIQSTLEKSSTIFGHSHSESMEPATNLTLEGLTARIADSSKTISDCFNAQGFRPLSFTVDGPTSFPVPPSFALVQAARLALIEATDLLRRLVIGPQEYTHWIATAVRSYSPTFFL